MAHYEILNGHGALAIYKWPTMGSILDPFSHYWVHSLVICWYLPLIIVSRFPTGAQDWSPIWGILCPLSTPRSTYWDIWSRISRNCYRGRN